MKQLYLIALVILFGTSTNLLKAQTVSQEEYEATIDYINCQFAELSLKDQPGQPHYADYKREVATDCSDEKLLSFLKTRKPKQLENNLYLAYAINQYKEDYKPDNQHLYMKLANALFKEELVVEFGSKSKRAETYPALKADLQDYVKAKFPFSPAEMETTSTPTNTENTGDYNTNRIDATITIDDDPMVPETTTEREVDPSLVADETTPETDDYEPEDIAVVSDNSDRGRKWMGIGLGIILLVALAYLLLRYFKTNFQTTTPTKPVMTMSNNKEVAKLQEEIRQLKSRNETLENEIKKLKGVIVRLENGEAVEPSTVESTQTPVVATPAAYREVFYMPIPSNDGSFHDSLKSKIFEPTESVYRFEVVGEGHAEFRLVSDLRTMQRAINGFDSYIRPVCQSTNAFSLGATQVITDKPGVAEKEGGVWKLSQRAVIHYE